MWPSCWDVGDWEGRSGLEKHFCPLLWWGAESGEKRRCRSLLLENVNVRGWKWSLGSTLRTQVVRRRLYLGGVTWVVCGWDWFKMREVWLLVCALILLPVCPNPAPQLVDPYCYVFRSVAMAVSSKPSCLLWEVFGFIVQEGKNSIYPHAGSWVFRPFNY